MAAVVKEQGWHDVIERCSPAVVTIRSLYVKSFEGSSADYSYATGFVVDAARGLIMTNRHVVEVGPCVQEAVFTKSKEEVELAPLWRDPIHDVGIMRFDPTKVKRTELFELSLNPEGARPGVEVRVMGNDAGEKLSVLSGTIARIDRAAPHYDSYGYNDMGTFYVAAASNTSGGSSGSPVLNSAGEVVALNAGGATEAASSFYLPLFRAQRALLHLQRGADVSRGELLMHLGHEPFDEVLRLGVRPETVERVRAEVLEETGMLKVKRIVKAGPADGAVAPGDVLVSVNGRVATHFLPLEEAMDSAWAIKRAVCAALEQVVGSEAVWGEHDGGCPQPAGAAAAAEVASASATGAACGTDAAPATPAAALPAVMGVLPPEEAEAAPDCAATAACKLHDLVADPTPCVDSAVCDPLLAALSAVGYLPTPPGSSPGEEAAPVPIEEQHEAAPAAATRCVQLQDLHWAAVKQFRGSLPCSEHILASLAKLTEAIRACAADSLAGEALAAGLRSRLGLADGAPLSTAVSSALTLLLQRGGADHRVHVHAMDLHQTLPGEFLEVSGAILHPLSLHQRLNYELPLGPGVVVSSTGYMFGNGYVTRGNVITGVGPRRTPTLDALEEALCAIPDKERFSVKYFGLGENRREAVQVLEMDRRFHTAHRWQADRRRGVWTSRPCHKPPAPPAPEVMHMTLAQEPLDVARRAFNALALCEFSMPLLVDAVTTGSFLGTGVILDEERGLVLVDRNTVPASIGDARLTLAGSVELPGKVLYLHPHHNFAILSYDVSQVSRDRPVNPLPLATKPAAVGENLLFVGSTLDGELVAHECTVVKVQRLSIHDANPPRFRAYNGEAVHVDRLADCLGGVLIRQAGTGGVEDEQGAETEADATAGEIVAVLASYSSYESSQQPNMETVVSMPVGQFLPVLRSLQAGHEPRVFSLDAEFHLTPLSMARKGLGLPQEWCARIEALSARRQVLSVTRTMPGRAGARGILREGDVLLAVDDRPVVSFADVDDAVMAACATPPPSPEASSGAEGAAAPTVAVTLVRDRELMTVSVTPRLLPNRETTRVVLWSGLLLQDTPRSTLIKGYTPFPDGQPGVYISRWSYGTPAHKYGLRAVRWITEVNGEAVANLDEFLAVVKGFGHGESVRLRLMSLHEKDMSFTLKTDLRYTRTVSLRLDEAAPAGWALETWPPEEEPEEVAAHAAAAAAH